MEPCSAAADTVPGSGTLSIQHVYNKVQVVPLANK